MAQPFQILENVCREFGFSNLLEDIGRIKTTSLNPGLLNIALFGRFKSGKSSFLNHLFGLDLLPTGATPVTNVITQIRYAEAHKTVIYFLDGHREEINREYLSLYVNEIENPKNVKQVDYADLTIPALKPYPHLRFIDTPGIGSMFAHNTLVSKRWVPGTGVAVLAIDPGHPMGEDEVQFLEILQKYTPDIRIILTKTDLYSREVLHEVISFIQKNTKAHLGMNLPVSNYSVIKNAPALRTRFIKNVLIPLETSFTQKRDNITSHKVNTLVKECTGYLKMVREANKKGVEERKRLLQEILQEQTDRERIRNEFRLITGSYTSVTRVNITARLLPKKETLIVTLKQKFQKTFPDWHGNLFKLSRKFEQWTADALKDALADIVETEYPWFNTIPEQAKEHFEKYLETLRNQLHDKIKETLDITFETEKQEIALKELPSPDISVSWAFDSNIDLLWFMFPMFLFKSMFGRYFERHIDHEVEKNLYRLVARITEKVNKVILSMSIETLRKYDLEVLTIRNSLEQKPDTQPSPDHALKEISLLSAT